MTINCMREHIAQAYDSPRWRDRAMHLMPDRQVVAIYRTMLERGKLPLKKKRRQHVSYEQLSMFDLIKE